MGSTVTHRPDYDCELYIDEATEWRWRVRAKNGEPLASGESYPLIRDAVLPLAGLLGWPEWVAAQLIGTDVGTRFGFERQADGTLWQVQVLDPAQT